MLIHHKKLQPLQGYLHQLISAQPLLSRIITLILIALTAWQLAILVWGIFTPTPQVSRWSPQHISGLQVKAQQQEGIETLLKADLFGRYEAKSQIQATTPIKVNNAPPTRLQLTLVGLVASPDANYSLAVISYKNQQNTYGIGEKIANTRATLQSVLSDRVIINNQGKDEALMLDGRDYSKLTQPKAKQEEPAEQKTDVSQLDQIRQDVANDPQLIFQYIRLSRAEVDDKLKGYRVRPGKSRELFDSVGLQDGDIATVLNGQDLTAPDAMNQLLSNAVSMDTWSLTVERDGQLHEIYIDF